MADIKKEDLRKEITAILKDADLTTTSAKKVRQQVEEKLKVDLTDRKKEVDDLVMECLQEKQDGKKDGSKKKNSKDDDEEEEEEEDEELEEEEEEEKPKPKRGGGKKPAKRAKKGSSDESDEGSDDDASDEEYSPSKKSKGKKGKPAAKKKKGSDSDSDEDWGKARKSGGGGGGAKKGGGKRGGGGSGGGYTRAYNLSPELAAVVGQDSMARHEVVRKVWAIIKERNLYDPKNKQFAICDDELMKVFGVKRFRTFGMMKYLKNHFLD